MAKYSTGSTGDGGGTTCELCGAESGSLTETTVAGADLEVCSSCASHGETRGGGTGAGKQAQDAERKKRAAQNVAKTNPIWDGDTEHWERDGTNYDDDPLPYLVSGYGTRLADARQEAGLTQGELAAELGVREQDILAIEQGRASQAGIGGGVVEALEDHLDVELAE